MSSETEWDALAAVMDRINQATLHPQAEGMRELLHPEFVIGSPGSADPPVDREDYLAAIVGFWWDATLVKFDDTNLLLQVVGETAVVTQTVELLVERAGEPSRSTWKDVWVFARQEGEWLAVWRTILDFEEQDVSRHGVKQE